jgi:L-lactate dehydrogenase complex protein LldF
MTNHSKSASLFLKDPPRADWHDETLWMVREKRDKAAGMIPEWENLRERASGIKESTLSQLDKFLIQFEENAISNGAKVHWAKDANSFNETILNILKEKKASKIVKSKSMLTEECGMNHYLEEQGVEIVDTDLGERIIQLRNEPPSHIVLPAIHLKKEEISDLFHEKLNTEKGNCDPGYLTKAAREHLRTKFLKSEVAITGVNFAVAETGAIVVCTNEGNADMGVHSAPVQIHCMGIEKVLPGNNELSVFLRLLARSATGQAITTYTSHYRSPKPGGEMHIVIVDNGRSERLGNDRYRNSLKCIRCGACMNTCPVYRRSGGFSYRYVIPGPIGSILSPHVDANSYQDLPFASSLCGACSNVCPVKIDIHDQIYRWRQDIYDKKLLSPVKKISLKIAGKILSSGFRYDFAGRMARWGIKNMPSKLIYHPINVWGWERDLPQAPKLSFKQWYKKNKLQK